MLELGQCAQSVPNPAESREIGDCSTLWLYFKKSSEAASGQSSTLSMANAFSGNRLKWLGTFGHSRRGWVDKWLFLVLFSRRPQILPTDRSARCMDACSFMQCCRRCQRSNRLAPSPAVRRSQRACPGVRATCGPAMRFRGRCPRSIPDASRRKRLGEER